MLARAEEKLQGNELALNSTQQTNVTALQTLLAGLVDYAGLFPPAGLAMGNAVANYAEYRAGEDSFMLGRFVTPVVRFGKFEAAFLGLPAHEGVWQISALLGEDISADMAAIAELNVRLAGHVVVDSVEVKTAVVADIRRLATLLPPGITAYCELDPTRWAAHIQAVKECGLRAKIRTGGLVPEAFPQADAIAEFLALCAAQRVAFKATAGLHHPLRCERALTYETDAPRGVMHGFLNVFLAAALAIRTAPREEIIALLLDSSPAQFHSGEDGLRWRDRTFSYAEVRRMRSEFSISFGSCSFTEPLADLKELGLL
jgi:hypothetical protein